MKEKNSDKGGVMDERPEGIIEGRVCKEERRETEEEGGQV